jgi:hypothetical protein
MPGKGSHRVSSNGWSPRQIITLVLALCLLTVLLPIGARAAGSLMTIVDSTTTNQARVQNGALRVSDLPVGATRWWGRLDLDTGNNQVLYSPADTGKKNLMIGSLTFTGSNGSTTTMILEFYADCATLSGKVVLQIVQMAASETRHFDFPQPLPIVRPDTKWCIRLTPIVPPNDGGWQVKAVGYYY